MKIITKLLFSVMLLSAFTSLSAARSGCCTSNCESSCSPSSCGDSCSTSNCTSSCFDSCGSCNNNGCGPSRSCCDCECRVQAHSTFSVRPQFQVGSPEYLTAFRDRMDVSKNGHGGAFQVAVFGGKSRKPGKLATFFTPSCKSRLVATAEEGDLDPQHFNVVLADLDAEFESTLTFCPEISVIGVGLTYRQNLNRLFQDEYDEDKRHFWFEISSPLTRVKTTMGLSECLTFTGGREADVIEGLDQKFFSNMTDAFNQNAWRFGKINGCCEHSRTRLADITFMIGWETVKSECCRLETYCGLLAPTGNERCGTYVFEPIVGHAKHWGIVKGFHLRTDLWKDEENERKFEIAHTSHGQYLFEREEIRSFDLKCKPWSRYMEVYKNEAQAQAAAELSEKSETIDAAQFFSTPGINVFTKCLCVKPRISLTSNTALIYTGIHHGKKLRGELGYNLYYKQSECIKLCNWNEGPALKATEGDGNTNPLRTINRSNSIFEVNEAQQVIPDGCTACVAEYIENGVNITVPVEDYSASVIKACDLDLESATHPGFISHTFYGSAGVRWDDTAEYPLFFDVGGSYEFACENVVLNRWTAWVKGGLSF